MRLSVRAVDIAGHGIELLRLDATYSGGTEHGIVNHDLLTGWMVTFDETRRLELTLTAVAQDAWSETAVTLTQSAGMWSWDNAAATVKLADGIDTLTVTLLRITEAPFDHLITDDQLFKARRTKQGVIQGASLNGIRGVRDSSRIKGFVVPGLGSNADKVAIPQAELLGDHTASGPGRFKLVSDSVIPVASDSAASTAQGRLIFVESGDVGRSAFADHRRFLVGMWSPFPFDKPPTETVPIDVIVHFTPSTAKAPFTLVDYPYGALVTKDDHIQQPYVDLAIRHLITFHKLASQLLVAKRRAVIVMPLAPNGDWGPFRVRAGLARFLTELPRFLAVVGFGAPRFSIKKSIAQIGRVVITGFSEGGTPAFDVISRLQPPGETPGAKFRWGSVSAERWSLPDSGAALTGQIREFWDVDSSVVGLPANAFQTRRGEMAAWFKARPDRLLRTYHTVGTVGHWTPDPAREVDPGFKSVLSTMRTSPASEKLENPTTHDWAQRWDDGSQPSRWTIVLFSDASDASTASSGYVGGPDGGAREKDFENGQPTGKFVAGHELMPKVAFGHAAQISDLSKGGPP